MIPLRDNIPSRAKPYVVRVLIALNLFGFILQQIVDSHLLEFALRPAFLIGWWEGATLQVPIEVFAPHGAVNQLVEQVTPTFLSGVVPLITSQFLHADLFHLGANLLFLWIFADNVEGTLGHKRFLGFYLLCGVFAGLAHTFSTPTSTIPTVGASGAIAGVLGAYFVRFPHSRILTLIPIFFVPFLVEIPAVVFLGIWFALQIVTGLFGDPGQLAVWAHVGGVVAGFVLIRFIPQVRHRGPKPRYVQFERFP